MRVIAGLGNPGRNFKGTRHNAGFEAVNALARKLSVYDHKVKFRSHVFETFAYNEKIMLVKPQTFMNLSGEALRYILAFYRLTPEDLIVVFDDVSLPAGDIRIRKKGGTGGHNGMKSIIECIGTEDFTRVRVGIGLKPPEAPLIDYVLARFAPEETDKIMAGINTAAEAVLKILADGVDKSMAVYNKRLTNEIADE
ncbi:MAG: aminoacyl-tRNA hydrolase [Clostridiales bacterium]|jgi:PTH1 family peptidyl-tRNA hydrolase|nr:aminoacyl-tRNA hydrolase [Clostridiales bacterium]